MHGLSTRPRVLTGTTPVELGRRPTIPLVAQHGHCSDPRWSYTWLFFSDDLADIARAKAICASCTVRERCLAGAVARREPAGVWGGECIRNGEIAGPRRRRGRRPPKASIVAVVDGIGDGGTGDENVRLAALGRTGDNW